MVRIGSEWEINGVQGEICCDKSAVPKCGVVRGDSVSIWVSDSPNDSVIGENESGSARDASVPSEINDTGVSLRDQTHEENTHDNRQFQHYKSCLWRRGVYKEED